MSAQQSKADTETEVPGGYESTDRASYPRQDGVTSAWVDMAWPSHNVAASSDSRGPPGSRRDIDNDVTYGRHKPRDGAAVIYTGSPNGSSNSVSWMSRRRSRSRGGGINFEGHQYPDGSGVLWHYDTREAIRTPNGLVLNNEQCWSSGFAHCSPPSRDESDAAIPFEAFEDASDADVSDITRVIGDRPRDGVVAVYEAGDGAEQGVYFGRDPSMSSGERIAVPLDADDLNDLETYVGGPPVFINDRLTPDAVRRSRFDVVTSDEYTKTRLSDGELEAHQEAGGSVTESRSNWRDTQINPCSHRADLQGNVIVRQGEWFFIPSNVDTRDVSDVWKPLSNQWDVSDSLPQRCPECGSTSFEVGELDRVRGASGQVGCAECDWNKVMPDDPEPDFAKVFDNHTPRDVARFDGDTYVRGTVRHENGDHDMINLGGTWHKAVTHDRDVLTYEPNPGNGGGGGWD